MKKLCILIFILAFNNGFSQALKSVDALRITTSPKIDGNLNDSCWINAEPAGDLIQNMLHPGLPAEQKSDVRIVYDDAAIYIGAMLYDSSPDSILHELSTR